nr:MAG TPA: hypothetical protein [Caudoviricetes sp.]
MSTFFLCLATSGLFLICSDFFFRLDSFHFLFLLDSAIISLCF